MLEIECMLEPELAPGLKSSFFGGDFGAGGYPASVLGDCFWWCLGDDVYICSSQENLLLLNSVLFISLSLRIYLPVKGILWIFSKRNSNVCGI